MKRRFVTAITIAASSLIAALGLAIIVSATPANAQTASLRESCPAQCDNQAVTCEQTASSDFECCVPGIANTDLAGGGCDQRYAPAQPDVTPRGGNGDPVAACLEQMQGEVNRCSFEYFTCEASCGLQGLGQGMGRVPARRRLK
ncbi:MAG: hypothetical protein ACREQE_04410 [Candidatus Binataceae bacterium]